MANIKTIEEISQITNRVDFAHEVEKYYKRETKKKELSNQEIADNLAYILINHTSKENDWIAMIYLIDILKNTEVSESVKPELKTKLLNYIDDISAGNECYFALKTYSYLEKKQSYEKLVQVALNTNYPTDVRALAIRMLAIISNQPFDINLPKDVGYWKENQLRLDDVKSWYESGMPDGNGYPQPVQDEALLKPKTKLEKAASKLQKKIVKYRSDVPSIFNQYLVIAEQEKINRILEKFNITGDYLEFLTRFSPQDVSFYKSSGQITIYGADDLLEFQLGYSLDENGNPLDGWTDNYLVIADQDTDPFCIDLSEENGAVYFSYHGMGEWQFEKAYDSLADFLTFFAK